MNTSSHFSGGLKDTVSRLLVKLSYKRAARVVAVSEGVKADLVENYAVLDSNISVLYNPYDIELLKTSAKKMSAIYRQSHISLALVDWLRTKTFRC